MGFPPPHDAAAPFLAFVRRSARARSTFASWLLYGWGIVVGVVFAGTVLGWDFVTGDPLVVRQVAGDNAAGLAAFRVFVDDGWHWPLLAAPDFGDAGVNVAFSDSIPLLAVVAKSTRGLGMAAETWWGGWFAAAYGLQGAGAVFAVRSWGARSLFPQVAAPGLAVSMPIVLLQTVHPSLSAHGLLLIAWGLAGRHRDRRPPDDGRSLGWFVALTVAAIAVHPYLGAMVAVMAGGVAGDALAAGRLTARLAAAWAGLLGVTVGGWLTVGGYLGAAGESEGGYGQYATSVLGPIVPTLSSILDDEPTTFEIEPSHPGYAYLGLGVAGLALVGAGLQRRRIGPVLRRNQLLAVAVGSLAAWAVSPWVRLTTGDRLDIPAALVDRLASPRRAGVVVSVVAIAAAGALVAWLLAGTRATSTRSGGPWAASSTRGSDRTAGAGAAGGQGDGAGGTSGPATFRPALWSIGALVLLLGVLGLGAPHAIGALLSQFRASGRFAWPLLYGVLTLAVVATDPVRLRRAVPVTSGRRLAGAGAVSVVVLGTAVVVQVVDTATLRLLARELLTPGGAERQDHVARLVDLVEAHDRVVLGPDFRCTYYPDGVGAFIDVTGAASAAERPIDRVYAARQPRSEPCSVAQAVDLSDPGALIVLVEPVAVRTETNRDELVDERCRQHATLNVCSHRWGDVAPDVLAHFGPVDD